MSVQFGRWNFEGRPPAPDYIEKVSANLAPYGPDSNESYLKGGVGILYRAFHTTTESHRESQPHVSLSGSVITWDGRLDNRTELVTELRAAVTRNSTDLSIVAAAYEKWDTRCFAKLIGDWALSIWKPGERLLVLAKDPMGPQHLYYSIDRDNVTWSTILDPLVLFAGKTFAICEEYIAGWFGTMFPAAHLTPYVGIQAVPPSSFVLIRPGKKCVISKYWDFDPDKRIRYRTDAEYEEHFRSVLFTAVQRRLRSDRPVLAELSGGMDSSSIVCMADTVIERGDAETPRLDTISWYSEADPAWDDHLYFTKVEEKRGCIGHHIDQSVLSGKDTAQEFSGSEFESAQFTATPNLFGALPTLFKRYAAHMRSQGYRVVLSGIGGDKVTGSGVPNPTPELQNLLARVRFVTLSRRLNAWAMKMRKSQLSLLWEAARGFLRLTLADLPKEVHPTPEFRSTFVRRNRTALCGYPSRLKLFGPLPSFQHSIDALNADRRLLAYFSLQPELLRDLRYPYLDRTLREFMYAIPPEQIVGLGQRRFLMRRALVGIVPDEVLRRTRKRVLPKQAPNTASTQWVGFGETNAQMVSSSVGIIDSNGFCETFQKAQRTEQYLMQNMKRTLFLELWLRNLTTRGVLTGSVSMKKPECSPSVEVKELQMPLSVEQFSWLAAAKKGGESHEIRNSGSNCVDACDQRHSE